MRILYMIVNTRPRSNFSIDSWLTFPLLASPQPRTTLSCNQPSIPLFEASRAVGQFLKELESETAYSKVNESIKFTVHEET